MTSLPQYSQHMLVLLFGTFRVIATNSVVNETNMSAQALGVSVAPSFFHTCVAAGKVAKMEDIERFKDEWIFFTYPLDYLGVRTDIDIDCGPSFRSSHHDLSPTGSLEIIPENCPLDPAGRLSISLDPDNCLLELDHGHGGRLVTDTVGVRSSTLDTRRPPGRHLNVETKSFVALPQVHQRQTERMRARSDWFLSDWPGGGGRGSGGCGSGLVTYRPVASRILSPRPTSFVAMSPSKSPPSTEAPVTSLD